MYSFQPSIYPYSPLVVISNSSIGPNYSVLQPLQLSNRPVYGAQAPCYVVQAQAQAPRPSYPVSLPAAVQSQAPENQPLARKDSDTYLREGLQESGCGSYYDVVAQQLSTPGVRLLVDACALLSRSKSELGAQHHWAALTGAIRAYVEHGKFSGANSPACFPCFPCFGSASTGELLHTRLKTAFDTLSKHYSAPSIQR